MMENKLTVMKSKQRQINNPSKSYRMGKMNKSNSKNRQWNNQ